MASVSVILVLYHFGGTEIVIDVELREKYEPLPRLNTIGVEDVEYTADTFFVTARNCIDIKIANDWRCSEACVSIWAKGQSRAVVNRYRLDDCVTYNATWVTVITALVLSVASAV